MVAFPVLLSEQVEAHAGRDLLAEFGFLDAAETNKTLPADEFPRVEARELGGALDHQHAGEEWPAWDVPRNPELVRPHVLVADDPAQIRLGVDDAVEHLHIPALRVGFADRFLVKDDLVEV